MHSSNYFSVDEEEMILDTKMYNQVLEELF